MTLILPRRSLLSYPAGAAAGIDPSHPAAAGKLLLSAIPTGSGNYFNLAGGSTCVNQQPTQTTQPTVVVADGVIGPALNAGTGSKALGTSFSGITSSSATVGAIFRFVSLGTYQAVVTVSSAYGFWIHTDKPVFFTNADNSPSFPALVNGEYYFVGISAALAVGSTINYVARNLTTGEVFSSSVTQTASALIFDKLSVGNDPSNEFSGFPIAAAMASVNGAPLSMAQLLAWAADPWSFWYPAAPPAQRKVSYSYNYGPTPAVTTTGGARVLRGFNQNRLAYPAGVLPGFDPSHVASQNMSPGHGLSAVAIPGGKMVSLLRGRPCTNVAVNVSGTIHGTVGPGITSSGGTANAITDGNNAAVVDSSVTLAGIIHYQNNSQNQVIIGNGTVFTSAFYLFVNGSTDNLNTYTNGGTASGVVLNSNESYFVAASNDGTNVNYLARSLKTGKVQTATQAASPGSLLGFTSSGTYVIQCDTFGVNQATYPIAAVSYTPTALSPAELLQWSTDPWAFWYPRQAKTLLSSSDTPVATQYAAFSIPQRGGRVITQMRGY